MNSKQTYTNPVLCGFKPDPSVVRVGDDYFLVNSTFQYFPAIVISKSKDLVHWKTIGHAVTDSEYLDLGNLLDSRGIWAPDISYYNGVFYIFATLRLNENKPDGSPANPIRRQMIVRSTNPEGPYSKPVFIDEDGIDPSHFIDDDGKHYMVLTPGVSLIPLNDDCTEKTGDKIKIWDGSGREATEGPHILKKDGFYYLITAEGGTGYGHCICSGRSRNLYGPYESNPYNPVMTQKDPNALIQRAGHGKLVQTQKEEWWALYLCGRPIDGKYCTLGRETALDPVEWTDDGWFKINKGKGPSEVQSMPDLPLYDIQQETGFDDFNDDDLGLEWVFVRNPENTGWSLNEKKGFLRIKTGDHDLNSIYSRNVILRREKHHEYSAVAKLEFTPEFDNEQAGLVCYYDTRTYIKFCLFYDKGLKIKIIENRGNNINIISEKKFNKNKIVYLKVKVNKLIRKFYFSYDNKEWIMAGIIKNVYFLSDEGYNDKKRFTGTLVGMYAYNGGSKQKNNADFDWFDYKW